MNRLRELRSARNMTQEDVGSLLHVCKSTVSKYESGSVPLPQRVIDTLCDVFDVTSDILLGRDESSAPQVSFESLSSGYVGVPLLGRVHAGSPIFADENIETFIPQVESDVSGGDYFYMRVEGDCMTGDFIPEGALILVRKQAVANNNDIVVVRIEDEVVLRHIKFTGDQIVLVPSNPSYEPMIITGGDVEIIGKVCEVRFYV